MPGRILALATALSIVLVSSPGFMGACGFCPATCPMHAQGHSQANEPGEGRQSTAHHKRKPSCHSTRSDSSDFDGQRLQRPPCRINFTLVGSALPPFVLVDKDATFIDLMPLGVVRLADSQMRDSETRPEVPPPIFL